jgi:hypothetical protein
VLAFYAVQGENQYEDKYEDNRAVRVDQYCQRTDVCECLHLIGRRKSWGSDIPESIEAARGYFKTVSRANFLRIFSPLNQMLALSVLVLFWKSSSAIRMCLAAALVLYVLTDVMTFAYFYPRNEIMFRAAELNDVTLLRETWASWSAMNWVRSSLLLAGVILSCVSLHKIYSIDG